MKEEIIKVLENYVVDKAGETRPYIDPDAIEGIAIEIIKALNKKDESNRKH